jgi:hypothetical protein
MIAGFLKEHHTLCSGVLHSLQLSSKPEVLVLEPLLVLVVPVCFSYPSISLLLVSASRLLAIKHIGLSR